MSDQYNPARDITPAFMSRVERWISDRGEVFVVLRYLRAGGAKDFLFCRSKSDFEALIDWVSVGTDIIVFRDRQLPIRGIVDAPFVSSAINSLRDAKDYMLVLDTEEPFFTDPALKRNCTGVFDYTTHLNEEIEEWRGKRVALGDCPDFRAEDHEGMISASKGGVDGAR
ncbi:MAG TPA: hypothetical protein VHM90_05135 [Phycisphaerae bacterium]|nr:hypothetical protein [Phycisphaerae bacterium]